MANRMKTLPTIPTTTELATKITNGDVITSYVLDWNIVKITFSRHVQNMKSLKINTILYKIAYPIWNLESEYKEQ